MGFKVGGFSFLLAFVKELFTFAVDEVGFFLGTSQIDLRSSSHVILTSVATGNAHSKICSI